MGDLEVARLALHGKRGSLVCIASGENVTSDPSAIPRLCRTQRPLLDMSGRLLIWRGDSPKGSLPDLCTAAKERKDVDTRRKYLRM